MTVRELIDWLTEADLFVAGAAIPLYPNAGVNAVGLTNSQGAPVTLVLQEEGVGRVDPDPGDPFEDLMSL